MRWLRNLTLSLFLFACLPAAPAAVNWKICRDYLEFSKLKAIHVGKMGRNILIYVLEDQVPDSLEDLFSLPENDSLREFLELVPRRFDIRELKATRNLYRLDYTSSQFNKGTLVIIDRRSGLVAGWAVPYRHEPDQN